MKQKGRFRCHRIEVMFINMQDIKINKIKSFQIDHNTLTEGVYISRIDHSITTYDMRTRRPNMGDYMDNVTMHSFEHMFATYIRNSDISDSVIYFGPMGCQTGFYLLVCEEISPELVYKHIIDVLKKIISHEGEVFGASASECGNYRSLSLDAAKTEAKRYLEHLKNNASPDFKYH